MVIAATFNLLGPDDDLPGTARVGVRHLVHPCSIPSQRLCVRPLRKGDSRLFVTLASTQEGWAGVPKAPGGEQRGGAGALGCGVLLLGLF